jgi:hypothetical protein
MSARDNKIDARSPPSLTGAASAQRSVRAWLCVPWLVVVGIGIISAIRFPVFDDEANALSNASSDVGTILTAGDKFHPPLWELVLHGWISVIQASEVWVLRIPSIILWVGTIAATRWAITPITSMEDRFAVTTVAVVWPAHLILPYSASWYALGAFLSVLMFGILLRVFSAPPSTGTWRGRILVVAIASALAGTTFAWLPVLLGELGGVVVVLGWSRVRAHRDRLLELAVMSVILLLATAPLLSSRIGPMLHQRAGGSALSSVGALAALFLGHSAPALIGVVVATGVLGALGLVAVIRLQDRRVQGPLFAGFVIIACLAATSTLNDKRILLATPLVVIGLGLALQSLPRVRAWALLGIVVLPAWLGWFFPHGAAWLFPRWQDPIDEIAAGHVALREPRLLITNQPAIAYEVAALEHAKEVWLTPLSKDVGWRSARWGVSKKDVLVEGIARRDAEPPALQGIDLVFAPNVFSRMRDLVSELSNQGWRVAHDRTYGVDLLATFRRSTERRERLHRIVLVREGSPVPELP